MRSEAIYPITLTATDQLTAVVFGGGPVGTRKVKKLLQAGITVRLISPEISNQLREWATAGQLEWQARPYQAGDVGAAKLIFAATNQRQVNAQIAAEAAQHGAWCNVADAPHEGNFHVPAVVRGDGVTITISTHGSNPARAKKYRQLLEQWLAEYG